MPVTFIGDVHGWLDRLDRLLSQAEGQAVLVGDLVDRGPDSAGVVRRVRGLCASGAARCLLGNHEWILCRALGAAGGPADTRLFRRWTDSWGGAAVLDSYGAKDAEGLRQAMGEDLEWMTTLPWVLEGEADGRRWCAVHAGLEEDEPFAVQIARLHRGWDESYPGDDPRPPSLFSKGLLDTFPPGLPADVCLVSGHTPLHEVVANEVRILCDTTGGLPRRQLSGVVFPAMRVITG